MSSCAAAWIDSQEVTTDTQGEMRLCPDFLKV